MQFQLSCLLFIRNDSGRLLLIRRRKPPNLGTWSPPGGKLEMSRGESPFECAKREAFEEVGLKLNDDDLRLFAYVSEKSYEGSSHWLMFLFESLVFINHLPKDIDEGSFQFYTREEINRLAIPPSDHQLVWPYYDRRDEGFWGIKADCSNNLLNLEIEANPAHYIKEGC
ncbi:MAG: NUDIX hydrolase [Opitutae bacterium]